jgi:hypothetical protein
LGSIVYEVGVGGIHGAIGSSLNGRFLGWADALYHTVFFDSLFRVIGGWGICIFRVNDGFGLRIWYIVGGFA